MEQSLKKILRTFQKPNEKIFPILKLKRRINEHPSTSIILNAANEILVDQFLKKKGVKIILDSSVKFKKKSLLFAELNPYYPFLHRVLTQ